MIGMDSVDLRYMQIDITPESAKGLPGLNLTNDFNRVEFLSRMNASQEGIHALIRVDFDDPSILEKEQEAFKIIKILDQNDHSALCEVLASGPISLIFASLHHAWWVTPTFVHPEGMIMTLRGTRDALRQVREELSTVLGDGFKLKLGAESLHSPEFIELLPERQRTVLEKAILLGYYDRPRRCTQRDIADSLSIKQATVSEHLQSAEATIIHAFTTEP
jgi:predicted DNA binding protein